LLWNQEVISVITELMFFLNLSGLALDIIMVVSSANSIGLANLLMLRERPTNQAFSPSTDMPKGSIKYRAS